MAQQRKLAQIAEISLVPVAAMAPAGRSTGAPTERVAR
jgi:hypothetical protein